MAQFQNQKNKLKSGFYHNSWVTVAGRKVGLRWPSPGPPAHLENSNLLFPHLLLMGLLGKSENKNKRHLEKRFENTKIGIEDLISIGTMGLIKAVNTFKKDKNIKLATYASRCIENEILMYIRKNSSSRCVVSIDEPLSVDWDGNELLLSDVLGSDEEEISYEIQQREERELIRGAVASLSPRERVIIELRYGLRGGDEMTQKEVADMLGISQSYISRLEKKIIFRLKKEIENKI